MTENRCIMLSFIYASNSVVLADGSRILIQGSGTVTTTPTLSLSSVFYLSCFFINLLSLKLSRF